MPIAMPDRKVHMLGDEVDLLGRCGDPEVDLWVGCSKAPKPVHEPFGAEVRRGADGQYARRPVLEQTVRPHRNPIQRVADDGQVLLAGAGDDELLAIASKQLEAKHRLERFDLLAYSCLTDAEFFCRPCEVLVPRRGLKGSECIQRW